MERKNILENYYNEWNEDDRLLSRFGQVEFLITIRFIEKYLKPGMKILEVGAGTGGTLIILRQKATQLTPWSLWRETLPALKKKRCLPRM